eukprot:550859_1
MNQKLTVFVLLVWLFIRTYASETSKTPCLPPVTGQTHTAQSVNDYKSPFNEVYQPINNLYIPLRTLRPEPQSFRTGPERSQQTVSRQSKLYRPEQSQSDVPEQSQFDVPEKSQSNVLEQSQSDVLEQLQLNLPTELSGNMSRKSHLAKLKYFQSTPLEQSQSAPMLHSQQYDKYEDKYTTSKSSPPEQSQFVPMLHSQQLNYSETQQYDQQQHVQSKYDEVLGDKYVRFEQKSYISQLSPKQNPPTQGHYPLPPISTQQYYLLPVYINAKNKLLLNQQFVCDQKAQIGNKQSFHGHRSLNDQLLSVQPLIEFQPSLYLPYGQPQIYNTVQQSPCDTKLQHESQLQHNDQSPDGHLSKYVQQSIILPPLVRSTANKVPDWPYPQSLYNGQAQYGHVSTYVQQSIIHPPLVRSTANKVPDWQYHPLSHGQSQYGYIAQYVHQSASPQLVRSTASELPDWQRQQSQYNGQSQRDHVSQYAQRSPIPQLVRPTASEVPDWQHQR